MSRKVDKQPYSGFIAEFEPERSTTMVEHLNIGYDVSDSFSKDDWALGRKEIFFIASAASEEAPQALVGAVFVERMHGTGGTRKPKYKLTYPVLFQPSVAFDEIEQHIELGDILSSPRGGVRVLHQTWLSLLNLVRKIRPAQAKQLEALLKLIDQDTQLLGGTNRLDRLAEQRDAFGIVFDMAGLDRAGIFKGIDAKKIDAANSFADLLASHRKQERSLIEHDAQWLELLLARDIKEIAFSSDKTASKVTILVADKEPLETALGVDLLIYQSLYNSLIFIQYKAMEKSTNDGWFYTPDNQLRVQLKAMINARTAMPTKDKVTQNMAAIRLNDDPFYFKLCERRTPKAAEASLVAGMSMNAIHLEEFLSFPQAQGGPLGGIRVGYKNCYRYFNNTEFLKLAKGGWIGTSASGSDFMMQVVRASLENKRALVYALIKTSEQSAAQMRRVRKTR